MIWLWLLVPIGLTSAVVVFSCWRHRVVNSGKQYYYQHEDRWIVIGGAATVVIAIASAVPSVRMIDHNIGSANCRQWGRNIGREVRYFDNGFMDYDCYVRTDRGNYVLRANVTETELRGDS